jgi:hypothetical protein
VTSRLCGTYETTGIPLNASEKILTLRAEVKPALNFVCVLYAMHAFGGPKDLKPLEPVRGISGQRKRGTLK